MAEDFPDLRDGDGLEPFHLNLIYAELRRWRKMRGDGLVNVEHADSSVSPPTITTGLDFPIFIQLTGAYSSGYPWQEVHITAGRGIEATGVAGTVANDPAYEIQAGDTTLTADGTVYEARRSPASGELVFDGKN